MKTLEIFDPALCCSSGVCGVDVDQALVRFAADADRARAQGARVERFNLAQEPMEFARRAVVGAALQRDGTEALPICLVEGERMLSGRYPTRDELQQWLGLPAQAPAAPDTVPASPGGCCGGRSTSRCC